MKRLANIKKFTFALLFVLVGVISDAQTLSPLDNTQPESTWGTEDNPYVITSADDWNTFASDVSGGYDYNGKYLKLTNDIPTAVEIAAGTTAVSTMAGTWTSDKNYKAFSGTFDGGGHTITFNKGTVGTPFGQDRCAPFRVISAATINNLIVEGTIVTSKKFAGGLIGWSYSKTGTSNISNCISDIEITSTLTGSGDATHGGFVGQQEQGTLNFEECIFEGSITGANAIKGGGYMGWRGGTVKYKNCIQAGKIAMIGNTTTYHRGSNNGGGTFDHAYYIFEPDNHESYGLQGTAVTSSATAPTDGIYRKYTDGDDAYYVPGGVITGLETTRFYGADGSATIIPVVKYYGWELEWNTDYIIMVNGTPQEPGSVTLSPGANTYTIEGIGNYGGSYSINMNYFNTDTWTDLKDVLYDDTWGERTINLSSDVSPENPISDGALEVNGTVVLNLNGKTINRNLTDSIVRGQVIRVNSGANLTINGSGAITGGFNWAEDNTSGGVNNDGGCIYNKGNLVLNNVSITGNKCYKKTKYEEDGEGNVQYNENGKPNPNTSNTARGGGIYSGSGSSLTINGGSFGEYFVSNGNVARGGGGAIFVDNAETFTIDNAIVDCNEGGSKGGGIRIENKGNKTYYIRNCRIWCNYVRDDGAHGGGVFFKGTEGGSLYMENCDIQYNGSRQYGSGFYANLGTIYAKNCHIDWNQNVNEVEDDINDNKGGGVCLYTGSTYTMDGGTITWNSCNNNGGAIYVYNGAYFKIKGNVIIEENNKAHFSTIPGPPDVNNVYLNGTAAIEVVGSLDPESSIHITPHGNGGVAVTFAEGVSSEGALDLFHIDDENGYSIMINNEGEIEVYQPYLWNDPLTWDGTKATDLSGGTPTSSNDITINKPVRIPSGCIAYAKSITFANDGRLLIEEGGQLVHDNPVSVLVKKSIYKATKDSNKWYAISSSVVDAGQSYESISNVDDIVDYKIYYDFFRYNEATHIWENQESGSGATGFTTMERGRGYIYRRANDKALYYKGTTNVGTLEDYTLSCSSDVLRGFNLIGNPYPHKIYKGVSFATTTDTLATGYYVLNNDGTWQSKNNYSVINVGQAVLVQAKEGTDGKKLRFRDKTGSSTKKANENQIMFTVSNSEYEDVTYALFEQGLGLNKISHYNEEAPMLYINQGGEDFAIATMSDDTKSFNLNFEAKTMGIYTLGLKTEGEFSYVHVIDRITGEDVDLLNDGEYSFIASPADIKERFIVCLTYMPNYSDADNEDFAYQSGSYIEVIGKGELQVFDVMGRMVLTKYVSGVETMCTSSVPAGVYVLRLNEKTQKIVIR